MAEAPAETAAFEQQNEQRLQKLREAFPLLEEETLRAALEKRGGHVGKARRDLQEPARRAAEARDLADMLATRLKTLQEIFPGEEEGLLRPVLEKYKGHIGMARKELEQLIERREKRREKLEAALPMLQEELPGVDETLLVRAIEQHDYHIGKAKNEVRLRLERGETKMDQAELRLAEAEAASVEAAEAAEARVRAVKARRRRASVAAAMAPERQLTMRQLGGSASRGQVLGRWQKAGATITDGRIKNLTKRKMLSIEALKAEAKKGAEVSIRGFCRRLTKGLRSEHSVVSFVSPSQLEDAITVTQAVQLFWTLLLVDLVTVALTFETMEEAEPAGRSRRGTSSGGEEEEVSFALESIPIVKTIIEGAVSAVITFAVVLLCRAVFKWSNSRRQSPPRASLSTMFRRIARRGILRLQSCMRCRCNSPKVITLTPPKARPPLPPPPPERRVALFKQHDAELRKLDMEFLRRSAPHPSKLSPTDRFFAVALEMLVLHRLKTYRPEKQWRRRQAIGWCFNIVVVVMAAFLVLTYATGFGSNNTSKLLTEWAIANGQVILLIEPFQIILFASMPFLLSDGNAVGRFGQRVKTFYNELLAP